MISIIVPTFNSSKTIENCLNSILCQTYKNFEILIVDNLSRDNTIEIIKKYATQNSFIRFVSERDSGVYDAMNKGVSLALGEWVYFLGSDDKLYETTTLENIFSLRNIDNYDVVYGNVLSPYHGGVYNGEWSIEKIGYNICHQAIFYKKRTITKLGYFNLKYKVSSDHDINIKWFFNRKFKHIFINQIIANYAEGGISTKYVDEAFKNDLHYNVFVRGLRVMSIKDLKKYAYAAISKNKNTIGFRRFYFLKTMLYLLRIISFLHKKQLKK